MDLNEEKGFYFKSATDDKGLKFLLQHINDVRGIDFALYRPATVRRKLELRLQETGSRNYAEYLSYVRENPGEVDHIIKVLTIKFSNFFRNPLVYELLNSQIIPELISEFRFLKVWSIGCAHGEEPYSVAIIAADLLKRERDYIDVSIVGTDIDQEAVSRGIRGEFSGNDIAEVKKKYVDEFFHLIPESEKPFEQEHRYRLNSKIKSLVKLVCADITTSLQGNKKKSDAFNLILCRNVLIYMNRELQEEIYGALSEILFENGYLILGETETLPESLKTNFIPTFPGVKIYRKNRHL